MAYATFLQKGMLNVNGLLEFLVLKIISGREVYVADILSDLSKTDFKTQEGSLYPLLSRQRREGLLDYEWRESEAGPPRKYYRLTEKGKQHLADLHAHWIHINNTINLLGN